VNVFDKIRTHFKGSGGCPHPAAALSESSAFGLAYFQRARLLLGEAEQLNTK